MTNKSTPVKNHQQTGNTLPAATAALAPTKESLQQNLMGSYDVLQLLHLSRSTLYQWRKKGWIVYSKIGGMIYFEAADIYQLLKERTQKGWRPAA